MAAEKSPPDTASRVLFVINHKSGKGNEGSLKELIDRQSASGDFKIRTYLMEGNDEENIRSHIREFKPDIVAAAGGDGTVKFIAGILAGTAVTLAIIPYGSANGMARELNITRIDTALELLGTGKKKKIDLLNINGEICIHLADVGLNARVVKRFEKDPKRGILIYGKHLLGEMFFLKNYTFRISYDGRTISREAVSLTFANASRYGTGAIINPDGILDDGKFELVIIKPFPRIKLVSIIWKMFAGKLKTSDYVEIIRCSHVIVRSSRKTTLQTDGEILGKVREINARILPRVLEVIVPPDFK